MKHQNENLTVCELADYREAKPPIKKKRVCKAKGCTIVLNQHHKGRYCYTHEGKQFIIADSKTRYGKSWNKFRLNGH